MNRSPRWVLDSNVIVSAFLWQGLPGETLTLAGNGAVRLYASKAILAELAATLTKPRMAAPVAATGHSKEDMLADYRRLVTLVKPKPLDRPISRDPDDDAIIACAIAARADMIVTGDKDLLVLGKVQGIAIRKVAEALAQVGQ